MRKIEFKEVIELFLIIVLPSIKVENEIPNINFIFNEEGIKLFNYVKNKPFKLKNYWTPSITEDELKILNINNNIDKNAKTIYINNPIRFFELLMNITNYQIKLYEEYKISISERNIAIHVMTRIWLRMSDCDFDNINSFLEQEEEFLKDRTLEKYNQVIVDTFENCIIKSHIKPNQTWDETAKAIYFTLNDGENIHESAHIYYAIKEENNKKICYIYAVQTPTIRKTNKKIERKLYKLNKGINQTNVHPNQLFPLIELIRLLENEEITEVRVPKEQTLNYRYHQIMSENFKEKYDSKYTEEYLKTITDNETLKKEYEFETIWYHHIVGKENEIRTLKTNKLYMLIERIKLHIPNFILTNTNQNDILIYKLSK